MSRQDGLSQWIATVSTQMPHLSRPQARVLALWSYGMVLAQSCGLTTVATVLALLLHASPQTLRQQLREWCYAAPDKKGRQRREVEVRTCFAPLLRGVLADRGLYARWLYRRIVAVGWHPFLRINQGGQFRPRGQARFRPLQSVVPHVGAQWCGEIDCFATPQCRLPCTLLACWSAPHAD